MLRKHIVWFCLKPILLTRRRRFYNVSVHGECRLLKIVLIWVMKVSQFCFLLMLNKQRMKCLAHGQNPILQAWLEQVTPHHLTTALIVELLSKYMT